VLGKISVVELKWRPLIRGIFLCFEGALYYIKGCFSLISVFESQPHVSTDIFDETGSLKVTQERVPGYYAYKSHVMSFKLAFTQYCVSV
jgi:hypothetical protein